MRRVPVLACWALHLHHSVEVGVKVSMISVKLCQIVANLTVLTANLFPQVRLEPCGPSSWVICNTSCPQQLIHLHLVRRASFSGILIVCVWYCAFDLCEHKIPLHNSMQQTRIFRYRHYMPKLISSFLRDTTFRVLVGQLPHRPYKSWKMECRKVLRELSTITMNGIFAGIEKSIGNCL